MATTQATVFTYYSIQKASRCAPAARPRYSLKKPALAESRCKRLITAGLVTDLPKKSDHVGQCPVTTLPQDQMTASLQRNELRLWQLVLKSQRHLVGNQAIFLPPDYQDRHQDMSGC